MFIYNISKWFFYPAIYMLIHVIHITVEELALPSYEFNHGRIPLGIAKNKSSHYISDRWFVHKQTAKCRKFKYLGSGGNFNNFISEYQCKKHLIFTISENVAACNENPSEVGQCELENDLRPIRYSFYAKATDGIKKGECKQFKYSGCGGNANNFETIEDCQRACANSVNGEQPEVGVISIDVPNVLDCNIPPNVDSSTPSIKIIYHNELKRCTYSAVSNSNKARGHFPSFQLCTSICIKSPINACKQEQPYFPPVPTDIASPQVLNRYYFKQSEKKCLPFNSYKLENSVYFDQEKNNFPTLDTCLGYCNAANQPMTETQPNVCTLPKAGSTSDPELPPNILNVERYYYNNAMKICEKFNFSGLNGNANNFLTIEDCENICKIN